MTVLATAPARAAWGHAVLTAAVALMVVIVIPFGTARHVGELAVLGLGLVAVRVAAQRHRGGGRLVWHGLALALALGCFALSELIEILSPNRVVSGLFASVDSGLEVIGSVTLVVAALGQLVAGRRSRDREAWVDLLSLLLAAGLAVVALTDGGRLPAVGLGEISIAVPVLITVVLLVGLPLAASYRGRSVSAGAMLAAALMAAIGHSGNIWAGVAGHTVGDDLPLFAIVFLVLAARHPSSTRLIRPQHARASGVLAGRLVGLAAALLVPPVLLILWGARHGGAGYVLGVGSTVLTALALWRLVTMNRERERNRSALVASEARLQLLLENAADVIAIVESDGTIGYISPAVQTLLGYPAKAYLGRSALDIGDPRDRDRLRAAVVAAGDGTVGSAAGAHFVDVDIRLQHASGEPRWVEVRITGKVDTVGIGGWVINLREVTDRKLFEDELRRQASTDPLTGLLNRTAFSERLAAAAADQDPAWPPAVLFVDIDDFKKVNDTLGHAAGDRLLTVVAARLSAEVRTDDVVARLGGDEFAVLLPWADRAQLEEIADRLLATMRRPLEVAGSTITVTVSVGGALAGPGDTAERLLHGADTAMYRAKRAGKNSHALLDPTSA